MKILYIGFTKLKYMPYLKTLYETMGNTTNNSAILYWNRDLLGDVTDIYNKSVLYEFRYYQEDDVEKWNKIFSMLRFRIFAKKKIREYKPDRIIVMHSLPAMLIYDVLVHKYNGRFLYDFRDTTYEKYIPFRILEEKLIRASIVTFVSSDGFRKYFHKNLFDKMISTHNIQSDLSNRIASYNKQNAPIIIGYWGFIRNESLNRTIILKISKDNRFELHYYGREQQVAVKLKQYANKLNATNVFFHGEYSPSERVHFLKTISITHNMFDDENMMLAMSNKYYDSLFYGIPQLCMEGSFMGLCASKARVGIEINPNDEDFCNKIWEYNSKLDCEIHKVNCEKELVRVETQQKQMKQYLISICD